MPKGSTKSPIKIPLNSRVSLTAVLVVLLIAAAYYLGSLRAEVNYLKRGAVKGETAQTTQTRSTASAGPIIPVSDQDHIRGSKNAQVILIEYSDLECPFCKQFHPTMKQVLQTYGDRVAWVYRHYPLSFHANAQKEAEAAECAGELGGREKFWQFVDKIFERTSSNGTGFALDKLGPLAEELGLDEAEFQVCLDSGRYAKLTSEHFAGGQAAGVRGTPGTIVVSRDGSAQIIPGAWQFEQVKAVIDAALNK